jgi:hypothetical protein
MMAIWNRRSRKTGLVGGLIDVHSGEWAETVAGIGAGVDSYYEYSIQYTLYTILIGSGLLLRVCTESSHP